MTDAVYTIRGVNGPVVTVEGGRGLPMMSLVRVGEERLPGEVVSVRDGQSVVQVYEDTQGLRAGEPVFPTDEPLSVLLGPGLLSNVYDGIARPLRAVEAAAGSFITRGIDLPALDTEKKWPVVVAVREGDRLGPGQILARTQESPLIEHRCMVPPGVSGRVARAAPDGEYTVTEPIAELETEAGERVTLTLSQRWPVRRPRPARKRLPISAPLFTGQRVIDTLFPVGKGGCAAIPGPFGAGKTMTQHQLARWCDADIIVYLGCGERGNEMTQVLDEFMELVDPKNGRPLMERTILIANTSNMPVAAREASVYTGMTIAEYYRDMGYHVALMADSTSRWAEALREISGRLEEMPAEESFPAYLPSRLAGFYERAGYMETLCGARGSVTAVGAVSPQGGDFSEPVTQNTRRYIRAFWALDRSLAYARHFPAINWQDSYSEYFDACADWYAAHFSKDFARQRARLTELLSQEARLQEIAKLIGADVLPDDQKLVLRIARVVREGFLQQNAFHPLDAFSPPERQAAMVELILRLYDRGRELAARSIPLSQLEATGVFSELARMKLDLGDGRTREDYMALVDGAADRVLEENA